MVGKLLFVSVLGLLACGCSQSPRYCPYCGADLSKPPEHATTQGSSTGAVVPRTTNTAASNVYHMAPARVFDEAQAALKADGFTIESAKDGVIDTGWKSYEGEFHVARRWEEQSRFRVTVVPDINDPTGSARLNISEETQRRSNPKASWQSADARSERAAQVLASVQSHMK